jgi:hypothetical protein
MRGRLEKRIDNLSEKDRGLAKTSFYKMLNYSDLLGQFTLFLIYKVGVLIPNETKASWPSDFLNLMLCIYRANRE